VDAGPHTVELALGLAGVTEARYSETIAFS